MSGLVKSVVLISIAYLLLLVFMPYLGIGIFYLGRFVGYLYYPVIFLSKFIFAPSWVFQFWAAFPFILIGFGLFKFGKHIFTKG